MSKSAVIYTSATCGYCVRAKILLGEHNIPYTEHVIGSETFRDRAHLQEIVGSMVTTVPQIFLDLGDGPKYVGGYDSLRNLLGPTQ
jgi:glutaredoxin 3